VSKHAIFCVAKTLLEKLCPTSFLLVFAGVGHKYLYLILLNSLDDDLFLTQH
jgi:hypothetical protein